VTFGEDAIKKIALSDIDPAYHPAPSAVLPYVFLQLFSPPAPVGAYASDVSQSNPITSRIQGFSQDPLELRHHSIDLFFPWSEQIRSRDDEAHFRVLSVIEFRALGATVTRALGRDAEPTVDVRNDRQREISRIKNMVNVVVFVR
jgi:hypothetical protein